MNLEIIRTDEFDVTAARGAMGGTPPCWTGGAVWDLPRPIFLEVLFNG